ncbi:MAG: tetratricopeptide repeat protein [Cyclobacteriaceae bacterium]
MWRTRIILILVSAVIVWLIFLLPKVVVENEDQIETAAPETAENQDPHQAVPATLTSDIKALRARYLENSGNQKSAIFADSLNDLYFQAGMFDSAAWFAEKAASFFSSDEANLKAGNSFYEAYTYAMDPGKQQEFAEKSRLYLQNVLKNNPNDLESKTKIAMTYMSSPTPMQGIMMLREVLAQDPKNELALFNMGMMSIQSGQYDRAIERFEELVAVNPKHTQAQLLLGVAYLNKGEKEKAKSQFEKVKELDQDPAVQATVDSYLQDLK